MIVIDLNCFLRFVKNGNDNDVRFPFSLNYVFLKGDDLEKMSEGEGEVEFAVCVVQQ